MGASSAVEADRIAAVGTGEKVSFRGRFGLIGVAALAALLALGVASPAVAKKKKKAQPVVSVSASSPFTAASNQALTANCGKGTHISGGASRSRLTTSPAAD
jgi:uncharacterized low-complexity protein